MSIMQMLMAAGAAPIALTYHSSAKSTATSAAHTFSAVAIGAAEAGRVVVVAIGSGWNNSATISSVTIGGVAATRLRVQSLYDVESCIAYAVVPAGTTADIVIGYTGGNEEECFIGVWSIRGLINPTTIDTKTQDANPGSLTLNTVPGGCVIAVATHRQQGSTLTFTGANEQYEMVAVQNVSGGASIATTGTSLTVGYSASGTAETGPFAAVSFGNA